MITEETGKGVPIMCPYSEGSDNPNDAVRKVATHLSSGDIRRAVEGSTTLLEVQHTLRVNRVTARKLLRIVGLTDEIEEADGDMVERIREGSESQQ